jgi:hypothetical protein
LLVLFACTAVLITGFGSATAHPLRQDDRPANVSSLLWGTAQRIQSGLQRAAITDDGIAPLGSEVSAAGEVGVELTVTDSARAAAALASVGVQVGSYDPAVPSLNAWLRPEELAAVAALPDVVAVQPLTAPVLRAGPVNSEGDALLRAGQARTQFAVDGSGIRVGVISDSASATGLDSLQALGELPADCPATIITTTLSCIQIDPASDVYKNSDEGLAMLEIVHDLAPGAILGFSSGFKNESGAQSSNAFIAAVNYLQNTFKANVIVDDVGYLNQPFFSDGTVALRAKQAADAGVIFVSAAGNDGQRHYQSAYVDSTPGLVAGVGRNLQLFAPGDDGQTIVLRPGQSVVVYVQWNNPFNSTTFAYDDFNVYLRSGSTIIQNPILGGVDNNASTKQPIEVLGAQNTGTSNTTLDIVVDAAVLRSGLPLQVEILVATGPNLQYNTAADSIYGHPAANGVVAVGAVGVPNVCESGAGSSKIESYSSNGPATVLDEVRRKPDVVAIDGVTTQTPGFDPFCGTSAAAPHVAAVAALMLDYRPELSPFVVRQALSSTAVDLGNGGFDTVYGWGRVDAVNLLPGIQNYRPRVRLPIVAR